MPDQKSGYDVYVCAGMSDFFLLFYLPSFLAIVENVRKQNYSQER